MNLRNYVVLDVETTTRNKGSPYDPRNELCWVGLKTPTTTIRLNWHKLVYSGEPYAKELKAIRETLEAAELVVGFNVKFDLAWVRRTFNVKIDSVWDCQLAAFLADNQQTPFPSLNGECEKRGWEVKPDKIKEYWKAGVDTPDIPEAEMDEYLEHDLSSTERLFLAQNEELSGNQRCLFKLCCADLLMLQEMEQNGMWFDIEGAKRREIEIRAETEKVLGELHQLFPSPNINFGSSDHLSVLLYGGWIPVRARVVKEYNYKNKGQVFKEVWGEIKEEYPRLVKPDGRWENVNTKGVSDADLAEENKARVEEGKRELQRHYSVAEPVLKTLAPKGKKGRELIRLVLELAKLEKLQSTYYEGLLRKMEDMGWTYVIHGSFNQCVAITGRLSSSNPNLQNFSGEIKPLFKSRFK